MVGDKSREMRKYRLQLTKVSVGEAGCQAVIVEVLSITEAVKQQKNLTRNQVLEMVAMRKL